LEEDLGITLLHRRKGRVYLTPEGEAIFQIATGSLLAAEQEILEIAANRDAAKGLIAAAVIANFGSQFVIDSLAPRFERHSPPGIQHVGIACEMQALAIWDR
jgi:DNA-binding transcriptional LysR family regulator